MGFDTMLGGQSPKTGNAEPVILYAADGTTILKTTTDSGAGKALAVAVWDSVLNDYLKIYGDGSASVTAKWDPTNKGQSTNNPLFINSVTAYNSFTETGPNLHAASSIVIPAPSAGFKNVIYLVQWIIYGSGTAPSTTNPVIITIKDGGTQIAQFNANAFVGISSIPFPAGGIGLSLATATTVAITDSGVNNNTFLGVQYGAVPQ